MMADFYSDMAKMASDLLAPTSQNGLGQGTIKLSWSETTPPANPWEAPLIERKFEDIDGAVRGVDAKLVGVEIGGTVILATDRQAICTVPTREVQPGDSLIVDGKPVHIISVQKIPAAGIAAAVKFLIRG